MPIYFSLLHANFMFTSIEQIFFYKKRKETGLNLKNNNCTLLQNILNKNSSIQIQVYLIILPCTFQYIFLPQSYDQTLSQCKTE